MSDCTKCIHEQACNTWMRYLHFIHNDHSYSTKGCPDYIPSADGAPVRHGRWILEAHNERVNFRWNVTAECSECCDEKKEIWAGFFPGVPDSMAREIALMNAEEVKLSNFCQNCGARMDGDEKTDQ